MSPRSGTALAVLLWALAAPARPQQAPSFEATREVVRIDVVALDGDGKPVRGLTAEDFEIVEKGRRLPITSFEAVVVATVPTPAPVVEGTAVQATAPAPAQPDRNRAFVVLFDDVNLGPRAAFRAQTDVARFLASGGLTDGDLVSLVTTSGLRFTARTAGERQRMADLVRDQKGGLMTDVEITLDGMRTGISDYQAMEVARFDQRQGGINSALAAVQYEKAKRRAAAGLSAIAHALVALEGFRGRKSLIVYSEGYIRSDAPQYDQVVELARRTRVSIFFADAFGDGGDGTPASAGLPGQAETRRHMRMQEDAAGAAYVAFATGGRAANTNDLSLLFREAADQASAYYLLGFDPPAGKPGERKIDVRSKKGLTLRSPDRYFLAGAAPPSDTAWALRGAMASMFDSDDVPFTIATGSRDGVSSTTFVVSLARAAADPERRLDLRIEARPLGAGEPVRDAAELTVPRGASPARLTRDLPLPPGSWQARVAVRDRETGRIGSVLHTFEVKDAATGAP
jgi:VWFA-related protein